MKYILNSSKGLNRKRNQDDYLILQNENIALYVLFDGVSSCENSHLFIKEYKKIIIKEFTHNQNFISEISDILYKANFTTIEKDIEGYSTVCVLILSGHNYNCVQYLNIGDSRVYHYTKTYLEKLTHDHNVGEQHNILTKFLGSNLLERSDFQIKTAPISDNYLLCTDGFYKLMENNLKIFFNIINFSYLKNILKALKKEEKGLNRDDSTFIIVRR